MTKNQHKWISLPLKNHFRKKIRSSLHLCLLLKLYGKIISYLSLTQGQKQSDGQEIFLRKYVCIKKKSHWGRWRVKLRRERKILGQSPSIGKFESPGWWRWKWKSEMERYLKVGWFEEKLSITMSLLFPHIYLSFFTFHSPFRTFSFKLHSGKWLGGKPLT